MQFHDHLQAKLKELTKQAKTDEEEVMQRGEVFDSLLKHPGWALLGIIAEGQQNTQMQGLLSVESSRDQDMFRKGLIFGQRLLLATPGITVEHRKEILQGREAPSGKEGEENG